MSETMRRAITRLKGAWRKRFGQEPAIEIRPGNYAYVAGACLRPCEVVRLADKLSGR